MAAGTVEVAISAVVKVPWYKLWSQYNGSRVCIYGPSFAGKSELFGYIATGRLRSEESANDGTAYFTKSGATRLVFSGDYGSQELVIKYTQDSPGGAEVSVIVKDIIKQRPNFIFLVFDASRPTYIDGTRYGGALSWFTAFANACHESSDISSKIAKNMNGLSIIWNKCDKLSSLEMEGLSEIEQKMASIAADKLQRPLGVGRINFLFSRCCLIEDRPIPADGPSKKSEHHAALKFMLDRLRK